MNDSPEEGNCAMSRLLRPSLPSSYFPLPQNSHVDDYNEPGKETTLSLQGQGKRHLRSHGLQLAMSIVLLLLAGTAGFVIGLSFSQSRLTSSSLPDTVPQGCLSSLHHTCHPLTFPSKRRLVQGDLPIQ